MTWPSVLHLRDGIPGDGFDGWQNYWNLWWVKQALLVERTNPFFTDYLYPPTGVSLLFHTLNILNGLWTLPIQLNFGLTIAYNSVVLFSFATGGLGSYLLALHTLARFQPGRRGVRLAAFAGGLVFTFAPVQMAHLLGHMQVFSFTWVPFYALWLLRTLEPWSMGAALPLKHQGRDGALCSLFLILASLIAWYYTLYLLIFTALVLVWTLWQRGRMADWQRGGLADWRVGGLGGWQKIGEASRGVGTHGLGGQREARSKEIEEHRNAAHHALRVTQYAIRTTPFSALILPLSLIAAILLIFSLCLSPLLIPMIRAAGSRSDLETGLSQNINLSADLLGYVLPSELHPLWGDWAAGIAQNFTTTLSERLVFAGFVPLMLGSYILIAGWRSPIVRFWVLVMAVYFVLSLGPYLHFNGQIVSLGRWQIPLPYLFLYQTIPFLDLTRSLSRYAAMVMLGLSVLVAMALVHFTTFHVSRPTPRTLLPLGAAALICFEFLPSPYPFSLIDTPHFFYNLAAQPGDYTVAELPMDWDRPTPLLHQTKHGKRLLTAYTSRDNPLELAWRVPVLQHWRYLGPDIIDVPLDQVAPTIFYDFNLRYIVLDTWQMPPGPVREATERWVAAALPGVAPIYEDGRLKVYSSPPKGETAPYLSLGAGWGPRQSGQDGSVIRTLAEGWADLGLHHPLAQPLVLELAVAGGSGGRQRLKVYAEEQHLATLLLSAEVQTYHLNLPGLAADFVKIRLEAVDPESVVSVQRLGLKSQLLNSTGVEVFSNRAS